MVYLQSHSAELLAHHERVTRHAQGVVTSLNEQKTLVQTLAEKLQTQVCVCLGEKVVDCPCIPAYMCVRVSLYSVQYICRLRSSLKR